MVKRWFENQSPSSVEQTIEIALQVLEVSCRAFRGLVHRDLNRKTFSCGQVREALDFGLQRSSIRRDRADTMPMVADVIAGNTS
jgi:hypothetical protein